jgi:hypothetical protein
VPGCQLTSAHVHAAFVLNATEHGLGWASSPYQFLI